MKTYNPQDSFISINGVKIDPSDAKIEVPLVVDHSGMETLTVDLIGVGPVTLYICRCSDCAKNLDKIISRSMPASEAF